MSFSLAIYHMRLIFLIRSLYRVGITVVVKQGIHMEFEQQWRNRLQAYATRSIAIQIAIVIYRVSLRTNTTLYTTQCQESIAEDYRDHLLYNWDIA